MAAKKSFNEKLRDSKDMPKVLEVDDPRYVGRYGGNKMLIAPPIEYDEMMRKIPYGKVTTSDRIRERLATRHEANFTCPLTAGIFMSIAAQASEERGDNPTPYWRTLKTDGELNEKYPGGMERQGQLLTAEGHAISSKGKRRFVENYEESLADLEK